MNSNESEMSDDVGFCNLNIWKARTCKRHVFARVSSDSFRFFSKTKKIHTNNHATYPIRIRDVSDTARAQNVDSVNILSPKMLLVPPPHGVTLMAHI